MINVQFSVTSPALDTSLLSIEEMRSAVGVEGSDSDEALTNLSEQITEEIMTACGIARYGIYPATLRVESLQEIMRQSFEFGVEYRRPRTLLLYRKPVISIESIIADDVALIEDTNYIVNKSQGKILYAYDNYFFGWYYRKLIVNYTAGWEIVPPGLKLACQQLLNVYWQLGTRDLSIKEIDVPGVRTIVYDTSTSLNSQSGITIPSDVMNLLSPYMNRKLR